MAIILIIQATEHEIEIEVTKKPQIIGRSSSADIKIRDDKISGKHCQILLDKEGRTIIKDLGSSNGTYLNNSVIEEARIYDDDQITIGEILMFLDPPLMNSKEAEKHTRDVEKSKVVQVSFAKKDPPSRLAKKAQKIGKKKQHLDEDSIFKGEQFDLEGASGKTRLLKIEDIDSQIFKKRPVQEEEEKPLTIRQKFKKFFMKKK